MKSKYKKLSNQITIIWYWPDQDVSRDYSSFTCIYKNDELVCTCHFSEDATLEEVERFLTITPAWQRMPGYTDCPCKQEPVFALDLRGK